MGGKGQSQSGAGKAQWRSRRGMLEVEIELLPFVREHFDDLSRADQEAYLRLLDEDDWRIHDWLRGRSHPEDAAFKRIIQLIQRAHDPCSRDE